MAAPNTLAGGALVTSAILDRTYELALADRAFVGLHPALAAGYLGNLAGGGSTTLERTLAGLGVGEMASVNETDTAALEEFGFSNISAPVGRRSTGRSFTDMLAIFDATGMLRDPAAFVYDAVTKRNNTITSMVAAAGSTFTATAGVTNTTITWAQIRAAKNKLIAANVQVVPGQVICVLANQAWSDLEDDLITTSNEAQAITAEAAAIQMLAASGYKGRYFGIDFFTTTRCPTANAAVDDVGCMFAPLGIAWDTAAIHQPFGADGFILGGGDLQVEFKRDASKMLSEIYYNSLLGVAKGDDNRGVKILTKAAA